MLLARKKKRRFEAKETTIYRDLRNVMTKMDATALKVDYDLLGNDPGVSIYFDRNGKRYLSQCETYEDYLDNLRAAQLAIEYTYRIAEAYGFPFLIQQTRPIKIFLTVSLPLWKHRSQPIPYCSALAQIGGNFCRSVGRRLAPRSPTPTGF